MKYICRVGLPILVLVYSCYVVFYMHKRSLSEDSSEFIYYSRLLQRHTSKQSQNKGSNYSATSNIRVLKQDNLIYFGSNIEISETYNQENIVSRFTHPKNASLVKRFPQAFCIGMPKAGTEALLVFLNHHPEIVTFDKEPNLFNKKNYRWYLNRYLRHMPYSTMDQITVEKSPQYVAWNRTHAPKQMFDFDPDIKLLLIVINPVDRALSHYYHFQTEIGTSFEEEVFFKQGKVNRTSVVISKSLYCELLRAWYAKFNRNQLHIIDGEAFAKHPLKELQKIEEFLGVKPFFEEKHFLFNSSKNYYCFDSGMSSECLRSKKGHKHPPLQPEFRKMLLDFFRPYNEKFFEMVDRRFNWDT